METCDVLIVGGGPTGSSCARALVHAGLDVIVLDKSVFPRDNIRPAIESAVLAAQVITAAAGNYSYKQLEAYEDGLRSLFCPEKK